MKGKSLFKKIGAIATTVAMLASVGVTGFAAYDETVSGVTAGDITVVESSTAGVYKVTVPYTVNVTSTIGVTMLAYGAGTSGLKIENKPVYGSDVEAGEESGMEIVGIDQNNAGTTETSFEFYVDTTSNNSGEPDDDAIEVEKGEKIIVLLSCDGAEGANGYLLQIGKADATVSVTYNNAPTQEIDIEGHPASGQTDEEFVTDYITTAPWAVKLSTSENAVDPNKVTVTVVGKGYDAANWEEQPVVYNVMVEDDTVNVAEAGVDITVNYATKSWTAADTVTYSAIFADPTEQTTMDAVTAYVKTELADKKVALTDGTFTYNYELTADDIETVAAPADAEWAEGEEYSYTMTIAGKEIKDDQVTIPTVTVTIPVTIQADTRYEADEAKAFKNSAEIASSATYNMTDGDTAQDVLEYAETLADSYKVYNEDGVEVAGAATWTLYKGETEANPSEALVEGAEYTAMAEVVPDEEGDADDWKDTAAYVTVTITVSAAPAVKLGDVNGDGNVRGNDWQAIMNHLNGKKPNDSLNDKKSTAFYAADINGDGNLRGNDWQAIMNHLNGKKTNDAIGK